MEDKVYEMDDNYKQAVADLLEFIKMRDDLAASIKIAAPEKKREQQELLADMDKQIERCEAALAKEYESHQTAARAQEKLDEIMGDVTEKMEMVFIYIKHRLPDKLEEMKSAIFDGWQPEDIQAFYDRVAIREATQLEEIIAENKVESSEK
jgi:uncharacterized FlaG/YvyC family protein